MKEEDSQLFQNSKDEYGEDYASHLLEQYKLYVESAENISDRRQNANNFFITINTALITILGVSLQLEILAGLISLRVAIGIAGIIICVIFWFLLRSYKQLNSGKFKVIHEIEKHLPMALYAYEWKLLGEGNDKKKYYPFSHVEIFIPWVFALFYLIIIVIQLCPSGF
ncbi:MAG: RipA family octameric membrane protein [Candidatus Thorarchaeota archaeon]